MGKLKQAREKFRGLAERGGIIFESMQKIEKLSFTYHFSLHFFQKMFKIVFSNFEKEFQNTNTVILSPLKRKIIQK